MENAEKHESGKKSRKLEICSVRSVGGCAKPPVFLASTFSAFLVFCFPKYPDGGVAVPRLECLPWFHLRPLPSGGDNVHSCRSRETR